VRRAEAPPEDGGMSAAEVLFQLLKPSNFIALVLALGILAVLLRLSGGVALLLAGAGLYVILGLMPVGQALLRPLEDRFPPPRIEGGVDGIVVLGGYTAAAREGTRHHMALNDGAERLTATAALARRFPGARVIVAGNPVGEDERSSAALTADLLDAFGIARERMVLDARSRSTFDNARLARQKAAPQTGERYVLVTSAFHMPRAVGTFRAAGWPGLIPYPVDYVEDDRPLWRAIERSAARGLKHADLAARELLATVYYRLTGRMDTLFPAPADDAGSQPRRRTSPTGEGPPVD
jgi:uncharacterized SAM-binding protein YcdF (DUF218 family)